MFAEAKDWHGMRRFRLRGLERVNAEALLTADGQNVKRLLAYGGRSPRRPAKEAALRKPGPAWRGPIRARGHLAGSVGPILQQPGCIIRIGSSVVGIRPFTLDAPDRTQSVGTS